MPIFGQNVACFFKGCRIKRNRYSDLFYNLLSEYLKHDKLGYDQICEIRDQKLRKMIQHCYYTVPYYTRLFKEWGINPDCINKLEDLRVIPILSKDEVKAHSVELRSSLIKSNRTKIHPTGGTTGTGLRFVTTNDEEAEQWAIWWRYRSRHGIDLKTWCGNFGGAAITPLSQSKPPYWRINLPGKQIFYSGYHISEKTVRDYANNIKKMGLRWLHGYPSNLANIANELKKANVTLPMKWVSTGAENLYDSQKKQIEEVFCVKPIQHYGLTEGVANISEGLDGELVVDEDFCCVEFIPSENENEYHVIGTSLTNYAMPLIRYDTGDLVTIKKMGQHSDFGRTVDAINGRSNEYVLLPSGVKVGTAAISLIVNRLEWIQAMQIIQNSKDSVDINILGNRAGSVNLNELKYELQIRFGDELKTHIHFVDSLEKTKSGKQKLVISKYNNGQ